MDRRAGIGVTRGAAQGFQLIKKRINFIGRRTVIKLSAWRQANGRSGSAMAHADAALNAHIDAALADFGLQVTGQGLTVARCTGGFVHAKPPIDANHQDAGPHLFGFGIVHSASPKASSIVAANENTFSSFANPRTRETDAPQAARISRQPRFFAN